MTPPASARRLFGEVVLRRDVIAHLENDPDLDDAVRQEAIEIARRHRDDAARLNAESWRALSLPAGDRHGYGHALRQA